MLKPAPIETRQEKTSALRVLNVFVMSVGVIQMRVVAVEHWRVGAHFDMCKMSMARRLTMAFAGSPALSLRGLRASTPFRRMSVSRSPLCAQLPSTRDMLSPAQLEATILNSGGHEKRDADGFRVVEERLIFKRYQAVSERVIEYPHGDRHSFDVLGHGACASVFVFPVVMAAGKASTVVLREYSPGLGKMMNGFPAGFLESHKHATPDEAAVAELSEEAFLTAGTLLRLSPLGGVSADKYSKNLYHHFLALDCVPDLAPGERDQEEWIEIEKGVPLSAVRAMVVDGKFNTPNISLAFMALDRLEQLGFETR
jgi:hypothetical protein